MTTESTQKVRTTGNSAKAWAPDLQEFLPSDVIPDALIFEAATVVTEQLDGDGPVARIPWVNDAEAAFVAEGAEIEQSEPELAEVVVATGKISQLIPISREQWEQDHAARLLSESVARAVTKKANQAFISQVAPEQGAITPPEGILTQAAITHAEGITIDLDPLAFMLAAIEEEGGNPNLIIANPTAWAQLRNMKIGEGSNASLLGAGTQDADKRLLGLPVHTSPAVPAGGLLVVDKTAIAAAVGPLQVANSEHVYFSSDRIALRATWRIGWKVAHPKRLGFLSVVADDDSATEG